MKQRANNKKALAPSDCSQGVLDLGQQSLDPRTRHNKRIAALARALRQQIQREGEVKW